MAKKGRPPSSAVGVAASATPGTSASRPDTTASAMFAHGSGGGQQQLHTFNVGGYEYEDEYGYYDEGEEEMEDESEDEDVFAFLPPTTAEQEEERRAAEAAAAASGNQQHQTQVYQQTMTTTRTKAEFAHSPFAFSASSPTPPGNTSNNPYSAFGYSHDASYSQDDYYSSHEELRPTTAAGRPTTSAGPTRLAGTAAAGAMSHPSLVSAPSFSFSIAGSVSTNGGNTTLAPALPITSTTTTPGVPAYPDPTFDPWGRASSSAMAAGLIASPGKNTARPDTAHSYTTNPYSIPNRQSNSNNPYAYSTTPGNRYPHPPPLSPPSPSTDSHPSTAGGLSQLANGGGEQFKLKRLNTGGAAGTTGVPASGLREQAGAEGVQEDAETEAFSEEEQVAVEEVEVGEASTRSGRKAVRVSLPGVVPASRKSVSRSVRRESRDSATLAGGDDTKDVDGLSSPIKPASGTEFHSQQQVKRRGKKSSKRYSAVPNTPNTPGTPGTPSAYANTSTANNGSYGFGYSTAVAGITSSGHGYKTKNPNAQPYYAYAGLAREGGYPGFENSTSGVISGGPAGTSGSANASATAANTLANGNGITKERRKKKKRSRRKSALGRGEEDDEMQKDLDLESGGGAGKDTSSIVKGGLTYDYEYTYDEYGYANGNRTGRKDKARDNDRDSMASVTTGASGSIMHYGDERSRSRSRSRRRPTSGAPSMEGSTDFTFEDERELGGRYRRKMRKALEEDGMVGAASTEEGYEGDYASYEGGRRYRYGDGDSSRDGESGYYEGEEGSDEGSESEESIKMEFDFDAIEEEDSPFAEVRASVSNIDDPDMPAMTIRMWFVGLLLCMTSSALNVFFNFRSPAPTIVPLALLLVSYPFGKFLAFTLPITSYRIPLPYLPRFFLPLHQPTFAPFRFIVNLLLPLTFPRSFEFSFNPGPWNIKEHVLVYIMANVSTGNPYALNAIVVSEVFYNIRLGYWFALTLVLATQLTGFGLAGLCRRFLVWPASMVWPQNLVACTLLNTLHAEDEDDGIGMYGLEGGKGMSRYKFFVITTAASFFFFFLPGYLFEALSVFSFVCWAAPNNVPVNQLFGVRTGLGMSVLTFDWTQISWIGSPLMVPWWAEVHVFIGFVLFYWIMTPILYYTNSWNLAYFPISANEPYDRFGKVYDVARVLRNNDTFDEAAYNAYSPLYLPATYAVTYLLAFALSTCVIVHTLLYHGHTLLNGVKKIKVEADDIHAKLMRNYPEVPDWWYGMAVAVFFALAVVAVEVWDTGVPVWALLLSVILPIVYILPSGFIYAMTGQGITLNILAQIIPGTLLPGNPLANMVFKAYSVQTLSAGTSFVQDLKLGHYVKVPPRATFMVQMIATVIAAFIQVGTKEWIFSNVKDICSQNQPSQLTCPHNQVFFTASAVWGLIGPTRQFGTGTIYHPHLYAIIIGAFLPLPFFFWQRRYPKSWVRYVSIPVILNGVSFIPPATGINYSSWFAVGVIFQYFIRKRNFAWWSKFNYVLSSALDSGTVISVMVIFFTLQFPKQGSIQLNWWGNTVQTETADWNRSTFLQIPEGGVVWKGFTPKPLPPS